MPESMNAGNARSARENVRVNLGLLEEADQGMLGLRPSAERFGMPERLIGPPPDQGELDQAVE